MELDLSDVQLGDRNVHIGCLRDISERQTYTETLQYQALHDDLTDLPNRVLFGDRVDNAIRAAIRTDEPLALLLLDLDGFKQRQRHARPPARRRPAEAGRRAARRAACATATPSPGSAATSSGSCCSASTDLAGAASVAWKLQQALEPPFDDRRPRVDMRASIGIALAPEHGDNIDDLLRRADLAMYDAKRAGQRATRCSPPSRRRPRRAGWRCSATSGTASSATSWSCTTSRRSTWRPRETIGVEALIRWNHPSGRLLMPGEFMPEVERNELMVPITEWVINEALRQLRDLARAGLRPDHGGEPRRPLPGRGRGFFETVERADRARWDVPPEKLTFELTESALIDTDGARAAGAAREDGRAPLDRRLRHRLLVARLPAAAARSSRSRPTGRS